MRIIQTFIFTFILLTAQFAFAQNNGTLTGQVVDSLGAVIPNATVTATNGNGVEKTATASDSGQYTINGLPSGTYTVRAGAPNFAPYENTEVAITAGRRTELAITMTVAGLEEQVNVDTGNNQVSTDPESNASATILRAQDLESLPEDPDELAAALQALAGPAAGPNGGQFYIDGFTGGRVPPREAIREIRINQNPFSAEYDRLGFGRIEILTKPGADKIRGQAFFNFNDESLNSRNPFAPNRAPTQTRFFGGNVSGPIVKNKASFFFDIDHRQVDNNAVINASILDSSLNFTRFNQTILTPTLRTSFSPRLDFAINERNTLVARYNYSRNEFNNQGLNEFTLPSKAYDTKSTEHNIQLTETAILSGTAVNETRFQFAKTNRRSEADNRVPAISVAGSFEGGGAQLGLSENDETRWELQNYTTWSAGKHSLKAGGRIRGISIDNISEQNFGGTFIFSGIQYRVDANGNPVLGANGQPLDQPITLVNGTVLTRPLTSLEQFRERILGNTDPRFNPSQFTITSGNPLADVSQIDFGGFITDDWRLRPDLTLSFGLRYELQTNISDKSSIAPRFGFAWSPGAGGAKAPKTVFRGGFGIFYERFSENFTLQAERFDGSQQLQFVVTDPTILNQVTFTSTGSASNVPTASQLTAVSPTSLATRIVSEDAKAPRTIQGVMSVERQLPGKMTLALTYGVSRTDNALRQRNINAPFCPPLTTCNPLDRPDAARGNVYQYETTGTVNNQFINVNFRSAFNPRYSFFGNYRLGRSKGDTDGGFPLYSYDPESDYGRLAFDVRHNFVLGGSVTLPWEIRLNPFIIASSGRPFNITTGTDNNRDGQFTDRPTFTALANACRQRNLNKSYCDIGDIANPDTTIIPRNYGVGPAFFSVNLNAFRTFGFGKSRAGAAATGQRGGQPGAGGAGIPGVGGRGGQGGGGRRGGGQFGGSDKPYNLTIGVNVQNLFNRSNLGTPIGNLTSERFGQSTSSGGGFGFFGGGGGGTNAGNRRVELSLRFNF